jgi:hypothetical protein
MQMTPRRFTKYTRSMHKTSLLILALCFSLIGQTQLSFQENPDPFQSMLKPIKWPELKIWRAGPYFGLQKGLYQVAEFGMEGQYKKIKLKKPYTHALHAGFNYNFLRQVLGFDIGYWGKVGRLDMTYGLNFVYRSDFNQAKAGLAPVVGFKLWQFHLQAGYHVMGNRTYDMETNRLFISLRLVLINRRKIKLDK